MSGPLRRRSENIRIIRDFDVLGHMDYIVRYGRHQAKEYNWKNCSDLIDEILRWLIEHGKGIEMNMAGFKYGLGFCHPYPEIIRRYRELGGEIITVDSDAHGRITSPTSMRKRRQLWNSVVSGIIRYL